MISLEKWMILTTLQKLPKNVGDLGKLIVAEGFKNMAKVQKIAQSGHTSCSPWKVFYRWCSIPPPRSKQTNLKYSSSSLITYYPISYCDRFGLTSCQLSTIKEVQFNFKKWAIPVLFFLYFRLFNKVDSKHSIQIFANDWIWTADLWHWKRSLCQLSHNHYPKFSLTVFSY